MTTFYSEGTNAGSNLSKWNKSDIYSFTSISGLGAVTCHGPVSGQYTLTLTNLPTHSRLRYKVYWHFVDSLDNEQSTILIDGLVYAEFRKSGTVGTGVPVYTVNRFQSSVWTTATYSYAPWGTGNDTSDGYIIFDTGYFDHSAKTLIVDHILGHDEAQTNEAMYLSHVELEYLADVGNIPSDGLILRLDAGLADSFPGKQRFVFRAGLVGTTQSVTFTHYHRAGALPITESAAGYFTPPAPRVKFTTTTSTSTTSTTTEPPVPITITVSSSLPNPILAHQLPLITFNFSLPLTSFELANVTAAGFGSLGSFSYTPGDTYATAFFTPTLDGIGSYSIFVPARAVKGINGAWNKNSSVVTLNVDSIRPEMVVSGTDPMIIAGEKANITFTSSNATGTFGSADITIVGDGTLDTDFKSITGSIYTANIIPRTNWLGNISVNVAALSYTNVVGNFNRPSNVYTFDVDTRIPSMTITSNTSFVRYGNVSQITFTSNIETDSFELANVTTVGFGNISDFSGSNKVYTANYTGAIDKIEVQASNYDQPSKEFVSYIKLNGTSIGTIGRGHTVAYFDVKSNTNVFDLDGTVTKDTFGSITEVGDLMNYLTAIPTGNLLVMTSFDATACNIGLRNVLNDSFGGIRPDTWTATRYSHVFIGYKHNSTVLVDEGLDPTATLGLWTPSTTYNMTYGSLGAGTGHGYTPLTGFKLEVPSLPAHTKLRYSFYWHFVDSIDGEEHTLTIDGVKYLKFVRNSFAGSPADITTNLCSVFRWVDNNTYSYSPWTGDTRDGYFIVDTGWINHTAATANLYMYFGADQPQIDEAMYVTHARVLVSSDFKVPAYEQIIKTGTEGWAKGNVQGLTGNIVANVQAAAYTSANGNPNTSSNDLTLYYDTRRPWVSMFSDDEYLTYGETTNVMIITSNVTSNFNLSDITVTGDGVLSNFRSVRDNLYKVQVTPTANTNGSIKLYIDDSKFNDAVGNPNLPSHALTIAVATVTTSTTSTSTSTSTTSTTSTSTSTTSTTSTSTSTTSTTSTSSTTTTTTTEAPYSFDQHPCPAAVSYNGGPTFPSEFRVDLGSGTTGTVTFTFDAFSVPDRFVVIYDGTLVFDSGYVTNLNPSDYPQLAIDINTELANLPGSHVIQGVTINHSPLTASDFGPSNSSPGITFAKTASPRYAYIAVFAPLSGTFWQITMNCPA